jgi:hypothetical protein
VCRICVGWSRQPKGLTTTTTDITTAIGSTAQELLREETWGCAPEVAKLLDAGDVVDAAQAFLEWLDD